MYVDWQNISSELKTIRDYLRWGMSVLEQADVFYGHGTDNSWDEALAIILPSLHLPHSLQSEMLDARLTHIERNLIVNHFRERVENKIPTPYLTKTAYFAELPFYVDQRVLIPRSPIAELIVEQFCPWIEPRQINRVLELGTGSGCIAIACAIYLEHVQQVDAVDISDDALAVAEINCAQHDVDVSLIKSDWFADVPEQQYDIIIANPPYVSAEELATVPAEYKHEPQFALMADDHGLASAKHILQHACCYLSKQGILLLEVGNSQDALQQEYPNLPGVWIEFSNGGEGVLLITANELQKYYDT